MNDDAWKVVVCVLLLWAGYVIGKVSAFETVEKDCRQINAFTYGAKAFKCEVVPPTQR